MTTYSDAANAYADEHHGDSDQSNWYHARDSVRAFVRAAYDAGHAAAYLEPATFTITEGHSPAAAAYAASRWVVDSNGYHEAAQAFDTALATVAPVQPRVLTTAAELDALPPRSVVVDSINGEAWQKSFVGDNTWWSADDAEVGVLTRSSSRLSDMGSFTLLAPAPATTEPVRLTDPDDPRIKPGARVRQVIEGEVIDMHDAARFRRLMRTPGLSRQPETYYLIAEAPDPDADVVANLVCELVEIDDSREWTTVEARRILAVARADS